MTYANNTQWAMDAEAYEAYIIARSRMRISNDLEPIIARSSQWSYYYARDIIRGPFPEGERTIAASAEWSYFYARDVLRGRFFQGEPAITTNQHFAELYARDITYLHEESDILRALINYNHVYARYLPDIEGVRKKKPKPEKNVNWSKEGF